MQKRVLVLDSFQTYQVRFNSFVEQDRELCLYLDEFMKESDGTTYTNAFVDDDGRTLVLKHKTLLVKLLPFKQYWHH